MQLLMNVRRRGGQFTGSVQLPDEVDGVEFWGVLELVAALDELLGGEDGERSASRELDAARDSSEGR